MRKKLRASALRLNRETLHRLSSDRLHGVAGAASRPCPTSLPCPTCIEDGSCNP